MCSLYIILPGCSHVGTTVWLNNKDFNKSLSKKKNARWELHKNVACCFEQILEATPEKTASVWPLVSYLTNHPSKTNKISWALLVKWDKIKSDVFLWNPTHWYNSVGSPTKSYIHQFSADTGCRLENLQWVMSIETAHKRVSMESV